MTHCLFAGSLAYGSIDLALFLDGNSAGRFEFYPHGHGVRPKSFPITAEGHILRICRGSLIGGLASLSTTRTINRLSRRCGSLIPRLRSGGS
jgi:hypothetical protein